MSAIDACYTLSPEKVLETPNISEGGDGEMNRLKSLPSSSSTSSHVIASEVITDIFNNAYEIVVARSLQLPSKVEKITPNVVGDILDNILSPPHIGVSNENYRHDETALLDDEIKKIIQEMKYPPEQKNIFYTQGVGDQLSDKSEVPPDKILAEPIKRNTLERKNRLTNLVRNSKQMLAKLVTNDNENEMRLTKSEEFHEKLLKVIDLEGDDHFMEAGSSSATGILHLPPDSALDSVDLASILSPDSEIEGERFQEAAALCSVNKVESKKSSNLSRKKWSLGARIMKYLKRGKDNKKE